MYLLDTNIVSILAPSAKARPSGLIDWMRQSSDFLYLSVVTSSEVEAGIAKSERLGHEAKAQRLREWWATTEQLYARRLLPVDLAVAQEAGRILDRTRAFNPGYADVLIAATGQVNGLTTLTANEAHFEQMGVHWLNPLKSLPLMPKLQI